VEKVPKQIFRRDAEKNDLTECATINDLMSGKGQETPEKYPLIAVRGFFDSLVRGTINNGVMKKQWPSQVKCYFAYKKFA
jgi:hypothetical protein